MEKLIKQGAEIILKYRERYPELDQLEDIKLAINRHMDTLTPEQLCRALVRLSILLVRVGALTAEVSALANEAYIYRKKRFLYEYSSIKSEMTVKDRENIATQNVYQEQEQEVVARFVADHLGTLYDDYSRLVTVLQSKLKTQRDEMARASEQV